MTLARSEERRNHQGHESSGGSKSCESDQGCEVATHTLHTQVFSYLKCISLLFNKKSGCIAFIGLLLGVVEKLIMASLNADRSVSSGKGV